MKLSSKFMLSLVAVLATVNLVNATHLKEAELSEGQKMIAATNAAGLARAAQAREYLDSKTMPELRESLEDEIKATEFNLDQFKNIEKELKTRLNKLNAELRQRNKQSKQRPNREKKQPTTPDQGKKYDVAE